VTPRPLVTIVVPCFNYARFLDECVGSVVAQTYPDWEAVVVDDHSTEGDVAAELDKFADARIQLVRHPENKGLAASRNTGIRRGTGELVLPLDADDALDPMYLERLAGWLVEHPDHDAVFSEFELFGAGSGRMMLGLRTTNELLADQWIPGPGTLYRRTLFDQVGGYFEELRAGNEDWDFWLGAASQPEFKVGHVPEPLYRYRVHPGSMSQRQRLTEQATRELLYSRHAELFDSHRAGRSFRAEGYRRSTLAELSRRHPLRATRHAVHGLVLSPGTYVRGMLKPIARRARKLRGARP
jgi:glycosyltransferase involved in cell wall biosynthesis